MAGARCTAGEGVGADGTGSISGNSKGCGSIVMGSLGVSMGRGMRAIAVAVVLYMLVGCSRPVSLPQDHLPVPADYQPLRAKDIGARTDSVATASTVAAPPVARSTAMPGVTLQVSPDVIPGCDPLAKIASKIHWQVTDAAITRVTLEISEDPHLVRKLFAQGGTNGEAATGNWVTQGMQFHLLDAATGKELATHVVIHHPCR